MSTELRALVLALAALFVTLGVAVAGPLVGQRQGLFLPLTLTPVAVGNNVGREEIILGVPSDAANGIFCCWDRSTTPCVPNRTPNATPGGFYIGPGGGSKVCKYADQVLRCISASANVSVDQAYARTATTTPTATATATPA